jgi:hypothetical protein
MESNISRNGEAKPQSKEGKPSASEGGKNSGTIMNVKGNAAKNGSRAMIITISYEPIPIQQRERKEQNLSIIVRSYTFPPSRK